VNAQDLDTFYVIVFVFISAIARDMNINGEITEIERELIVMNA
jgi:hypothetical protein